MAESSHYARYRFTLQIIGGKDVLNLAREVACVTESLSGYVRLVDDVEPFF